MEVCLCLKDLNLTMYIKCTEKLTRLKIPWINIIDEDMNNFLDIWCDAKNCSKELVFVSLLTLTSAISGPKVTVATRNRSFVSPINHFIISVMDPGGGKSNVFARVLKPVMEDFKRSHGSELNLENYTTAGMQRHQEESEGYGIVTSDEGQKILTQIRQKEQKGNCFSHLNIIM